MSGIQLPMYVFTNTCVHKRIIHWFHFCHLSQCLPWQWVFWLTSLELVTGCYYFYSSRFIRTPNTVKRHCHQCGPLIPTPHVTFWDTEKVADVILLKVSEEYQQYDDQRCLGSVRTNWVCACLGKKKDLFVQRHNGWKTVFEFGSRFLFFGDCELPRSAGYCDMPSAGASRPISPVHFELIAH